MVIGGYHGWYIIQHNLPLGIRWSWRNDNSYTIIGSILCYYGIFSRRYAILKLPKLCKSLNFIQISRRSSVQWINFELPSRGQSKNDRKKILEWYWRHFYMHYSSSFKFIGGRDYVFFTSILNFSFPLYFAFPRNVFTKFLSHWVLFKHVLNPLAWDPLAFPPFGGNDFTKIFPLEICLLIVYAVKTIGDKYFYWS